MRRRDFILMVGGAALLSRAARAQQTSPVVGVLGIATLEAVRSNFVAARARLAEMGYVEGHSLAVEYRGADYQQERLAVLAAELVQRRVAVIYASSGPAISAAKAATTTIPVIFFTGFDPVESGFVSSLNRPGGNVTGVSILSSELNFKRFELLHELVPAAKTVAYLYTHTGITSEDSFLKDMQRAADAISTKLLLFNVRNRNDLDESFVRAEDAGAGALLVNSDAVFQNNRQKVIALAAYHGMPAMYFVREYVAEGGLISYGTNYREAYRQVGEYLGRVLKGEKTENLPVQQITKLELLVNLKTAKALGLTVPPTLLARADEVIE